MPRVVPSEQDNSGVPAFYTERIHVVQVVASPLDQLKAQIMCVANEKSTWVRCCLGHIEQVIHSDSKNLLNGSFTHVHVQEV